MDRRALLYGVAGATVGYGLAPLTGFLEEIGKAYYLSRFPPKSLAPPNDEALLRLLGGKRAAPVIFAGEGNALRPQDMAGQLSRYLRDSAAELATHVSSTLGLPLKEVDDNSSEPFRYSRKSLSIFLGGPPANTVTSRLLGYLERSVSDGSRTIRLPYPDPSRKVIRWAPIYGHTGYGVYDGQLEEVIRYSAGHTLVQRPLYKVLDQETGEVLIPRVVNGLLMSEWLSIVRLLDGGSPKIVIGGLHGYSIEAFFMRLGENLEWLRRTVITADQYQVLVPVTLINVVDKSGMSHVEGRLEWNGAKLQTIRDS